MKQLFAILTILSIGLTVNAQLRPADYDDIDFVFDSIYSYQYQKAKQEKDSIALHKLNQQLASYISNAEKTQELTITNSSIHRLPSGIEKLNNLEAVYFNNCKNINVDVVLDQLKGNTQLKEISFINCNLYQLPGTISQYKQLEKLSIEGNKIVVLPESLQQLTRLNEINVSKSKYVNEELLFNQLSKMPQVKHVNAAYCAIRSIPESATIQTYEKLNLGGNLLEQVPANLKVNHLYLSSNPNLDQSQLFLNLAKNTSLLHLDVSYNNWEELSATIGKLVTLKHLDLRGNQLSELPNEIGNLVQLEVLKVDNTGEYVFTNQLKNLPSSIGNLVQLDSLFLRGNLLTSLPNNISALQQLRYLDLSFNKFEQFPEKLTSLKQLNHLNLAVNHVPTLPSAIGDLSELRYLNIQGDFFVHYTKKLKVLPESIGQLKQLETLIFSDNVVEVIPESISQCQKLAILDAKDNLLQTLPNSFGELRNLAYCNLKANEIQRLPQSMGRLQGIKKLDLSFNFNLDSDAAAPILGKLKSLSYLNIADCYFTEQAANLLLDALPTTNVVTFVERNEKE